MLTLAHPWLLLLLPLPLLVWWLAPPHREPRRALVVPFLDRIARHSGQTPGEGAVIMRGAWWRGAALLIAWCCVVLAMARPQVIEQAVTKQIPVRDLLLAVDLSGSMDTADFKNASGKTVNRLTAVKEVLDSFLAKRKGDRVGLILFGSAPFVQAPFTEDLKVCRKLLHEAQVGMAGPQTAFGDALGLAINTFERSEMKSRVLIALTDGNDTASQVPPPKAAEIARDQGIVIHTVAVGDPKAAGEQALDEATLRTVAATTGGSYAHAGDLAQLEAIYTKLDALETHQAETVSHRPRRDVFWWPLVLALVVSAAQQAWGLEQKAAKKAKVLEERGMGFASFALFCFFPGVAPAWTFHFIRPWWLLALLPLGLLFWLLHRRQDAALVWKNIVAPHLLPFLLSGQNERSRFSPLLLLGIGWLTAVVAISGPTWRHEPAPFADDTAALAIVVKVTPSMMTEDVQPGRLARGVQKIHDLLAWRRGAKTALIAYAGTEHLVMPATTDEGIINTFAQSLDPKIMPEDGDSAAAALRMADRALADAGGGSIFWITDSIAPEQATALATWRKTSSTTVRLLPALAPGGELDALLKAARAADVDVVNLSADDSDVTALARASKFAPATASGARSDRWQESGYWLTPLLAGLMLPFFRKGWMTSTGAKR